MPETFSPSYKGKFSSSSSFLGGGLVNNRGRGQGEREKVSESESWHAEPVKLGVVTSAVLGRICKNEPLLHLLEVSLLHAL